MVIFYKFLHKKNWSQNYPNMCYNKVCYKGPALYFKVCKQVKMAERIYSHIKKGLSQ